MKKLISLIGLSLMLTNAAFAQDIVTCADIKKSSPEILYKVMKEREAFENQLVKKIVDRAAVEGRLSKFERDMLLSDSKIEILDRTLLELKRIGKCLDLEIAELQARIGR